MARDWDFSKSTIDKLAKDVAYHCSMCRTPTGGGGGAIGEAAHINSGAENGPRYRSELSREYLKSEENGIHLCPTCHTKADNKSLEEEYSVEWLKSQKSGAIEWAKNRLIKGEINNNDNYNIGKLIDDFYYGIEMLNGGTAPYLISRREYSFYGGCPELDPSILETIQDLGRKNKAAKLVNLDAIKTVREIQNIFKDIEERIVTKYDIDASNGTEYLDGDEGMLGRIQLGEMIMEKIKILDSYRDVSGRISL